MADGTLHTGGGGTVLFGDGRIKHLGNAVDDLRFPDGHNDAIPDILVALDMRRDADLHDDLGDDGFQVHHFHGGTGRGNRFFPGGRGAHHFYPLGNDIGIERLDKVIGGACPDQLIGDAGRIHAGHGKDGGLDAALPAGNGHEHTQAIQAAH